MDGRNLGRVIAAVMTAAALLGGVAPPAGADATVPDTPTDLGLEVTLRAVATLPDSSFGTAPRLNAMATMGERLFVVEERDGLVYELSGEVDGPRTATVFLDVAAAMTAAGTELDRSSVFHGGLRSVAFHPDIADNGLLYVSAMAERSSAPSSTTYLSDVAEPIAADSVLIEFRIDESTGLPDPTSLREVFRVGMPVYDHPIKQIAFDRALPAGHPERGLLFVGHGDGSVQSAVAGGGQNPDALGKVLRIDPLATATSPYSVPADNPFVGDPSMPDEVYSLGHRNPHSIAFATVDGARVALVTEPGRDNVEEVNLLTPGGDFGWPLREGTFVHRPDGGGGQLGIDPLPANDADFGFTYPVAQYATGNPRGERFGGFGIVGGFAVQNGSALDGNFFFADFPRRGTLFHLDLDTLDDTVTTLDPGDAPSELTRAPIGLASVRFDHDGDDTTAPLERTSLTDVFDDAATYETDRADVRFGQGPNGELYISSKRNNTVYVVLESIAPPTIAEATTLAEIIDAPDYTAGDAQVLRLYQAFFTREPDLGGAKFWLGQRQTGRSVESMAAFFAESPEFRSRYGAPDNSTYLTIVYRNVLGRGPDAGGHAWWLDRMNRGMSRAKVVLMIANEPEFIGLHPYGALSS